MRSTITALTGAVALLAATAMTTAGIAAAAPTAPSAPPTIGNGPASTTFLPAFAFSLTQPDAAPAGTNDFSCRPTAAHPRPVVLVHGTWVNQYNSFARLAPALKRQGYCVFAVVHGKETRSLIGKIPAIRGTDDIDVSGEQVARFVDTVLLSTGTTQVDMIGYSLGGPVIRDYLRFHGGVDTVAPAKNKVRNVITIGATNHGTTLSGIATLGKQINALGIDVLGFAPAIIGTSPIQQVVGSPFMTRLNTDGDTEAGVQYTVIGSKYDEITTPSELTYLTAGKGAVTNVRLQQGCSADLSDHLALPYSPRTLSIVSSTLANGGVPNAKDFTCSPVLPIFGG
ncbi:triacylglycerol lipase [Williamsia sp. CHRR-6]|uniref:esterase/lipase family protein n=1 Tax=Williamsia sp. CHRR-6 TaxID=2835871 RepID=UPI001BDA7F64|nr:alpha/beta fold hydrolase [Williamsia sp. CHRR-6]MBT0565747.1 alpha/beta fold hydrolase [Williamsia sp. CHRR-6]